LPKNEAGRLPLSGPPLAFTTFISLAGRTKPITTSIDACGHRKVSKDYFFLAKAWVAPASTVFQPSAGPLNLNQNVIVDSFMASPPPDGRTARQENARRVLPPPHREGIQTPVDRLAVVGDIIWQRTIIRTMPGAAGANFRCSFFLTRRDPVQNL